MGDGLRVCAKSIHRQYHSLRALLGVFVGAPSIGPHDTETEQIQGAKKQDGRQGHDVARHVYQAGQAPKQRRAPSTRAASSPSVPDSISQRIGMSVKANTLSAR